MIKGHIDNYNMFLAIEHHFDKHPELWRNLPSVAATKELLTEL
jgi:hypothetical protein